MNAFEPSVEKEPIHNLKSFLIWFLSEKQYKRSNPSYICVFTFLNGWFKFFPPLICLFTTLTHSPR